MQGKRIDRIGHLIQMELGELILKRVKDPRLGFVTVTHVDVGRDLKYARVYVSIMGAPKTKEASLVALEHSAGFLQREIGAAIKIRFTPKLTFCLDDSLDRGMEIDRVLQEIEKEKKPHEKK